MAKHEDNSPPNKCGESEFSRKGVGPHPDEKAERGRESSVLESSKAPRAINAVELMEKDIPALRWVVRKLIPEGLTILAGKPKMGKSWLGLAFALSTSTGGTVLGVFHGELGEALNLALEDSERRLQTRLEVLLKGHAAPDKLHFVVEWRRLDRGGADDLDQWLTEHPGCRLVIIDTLQKVRAPQKNNANMYAEDYQAVAALKGLSEKHHVAIVAIHHLRKEPADDPIDEVSGSTGLTGVADAVMVLKRKRGAADALLVVTGRDVEEQQLPLKWDKETATWRALEGECNTWRSHERVEILRVLSEAEAPMRPSEVANKLGKQTNPVKQLMWKMGRDGDLQTDNGRYWPTENNR